MDDNNNHWDAKQMFEYLRDDIKINREENRQLATETNAKIDRLVDMLSKHVADDSRNFQDLQARIGNVETTDKTKDAVKKTGWERIGQWALIVVGIVTAYILALPK